MQRDGAHVQPVVDAALRRAMNSVGLRWVDISGQGEARIAMAWQALQALLTQRASNA